MSLADRMDGTYEPPILTEPQGGPIPESTDVQAAAADPGAQRLQDQWDAAKARLLARWPKIAGPLVDELVQQAETAAAAGDLALLAELRASAGVVAAVAVPLAKSGTELALEAAAGVVEEAAAQGAEVDAPDEPAADQIVKRADVVARIIANGYASGAAKTALQLTGAAPGEVRDEVERHLTELGQSTNGLVGTEIAGLLSAAQFAGRLAVLEQHPATSYVSVEVNDRAKCARCAEIAGTEYPTLRAALADYIGGGIYRECLGRSRCRGYVRPRW